MTDASEAYRTRHGETTFLFLGPRTCSCRPLSERISTGVSMSHTSDRAPLDVLGLGESSVDHVNLLPAAPLARGTASKLRISSGFDAAGGQIPSMLAACSCLGLHAD